MFNSLSFVFLSWLLFPSFFVSSFSILPVSSLVGFFFLSFFFFSWEPSGAEHESDFLDHLCSPRHSVQSLHRHDGLQGHDSLPPGNSPLLSGVLRRWEHTRTHSCTHTGRGTYECIVYTLSQTAHTHTHKFSPKNTFVHTHTHTQTFTNHPHIWNDTQILTQCYFATLWLYSDYFLSTSVCLIFCSYTNTMTLIFFFFLYFSCFESN